MIESYCHSCHFVGVRYQNTSKLWITNLFVTTFVKNITFHHFRGHFGFPLRLIFFKNAVVWIILSKSIVGLRYLLKIGYSFHLLLVLGSFLSKKVFDRGLFWDSHEAKIFHGECNMNHNVKIQSWAQSWAFGRKIGYDYQFFSIL